MNVDTVTMRRRGLGALVVVVMGLLLGAPTAAQAALGITATPSSPRPGEPVTFSAGGSCSTCTSWSWKVGSWTLLDSGTGYPDAATLTSGFSATGVYRVSLSYTWFVPPFFWPDDTVSKEITVVANKGPAAAFTASATDTVIGRSVTFTDTSTDPEGDPLTRAWDLDNDGAFDDGDGRTASHTFATRGTKTARLRVRDSFGAESITTRSVAVANAAPTVTLTVSPTTVMTGEPVAFSAAGTDPDGGAVAYAWDLDGDGAYDDSTAAAPPSRSYPRSSARTIGVRVTDDDGDPATSTVQRTQVVAVMNRGPSIPTITASPAVVQRGGTVQLTAASTDPEGTAITYAWDFGIDGTIDATGATVTRTMPESGVLTARVGATDEDHGSGLSAPFSLTAGNRAPTAAFTVSAAEVTIGQQVTLTDTSSDGDGQPLTRAWDLDDDGAYDDGTGVEAITSFSTSGIKTVRLQVSDGTDTAVATRTITVRNVAPEIPDPEPPPAPGSDVIAAADSGTPFLTDPPLPAPVGAPAPAPTGTSGAAKPAKTTRTARLLRPFPRIRIQGRLTRRGARFTRITITAPRGSRIAASCTGRGCPSQTVRGTAGRSGVVRLTRLLGSYRAGTRIVIRVTRAGAIGKHTTITVRRGRAPKRVDRCLRPAATVPTRCPAN